MKIEQIAYANKKEYMELINPKKVPITQLSPNKEIEGTFCIPPYLFFEVLKNCFFYDKSGCKKESLVQIIFDEYEDVLNKKQKDWLYQLSNDISQNHPTSDTDIQRIYQITLIPQIDTDTCKNLKSLKKNVLDEHTIELVHLYKKRIQSFFEYLAEPDMQLKKKFSSPNCSPYLVDIVTPKCFYTILTGNSMPSKFQYITLVAKYALALPTYSNECPESIGFYNPRTNQIYKCPVSLFDSSLFQMLQTKALKMPHVYTYEQILNSNIKKPKNEIQLENNNGGNSLENLDITPNDNKKSEVKSHMYLNTTSTDQIAENKKSDLPQMSEYTPRKNGYYKSIKTKGKKKKGLFNFLYVCFFIFAILFIVYLITPESYFDTFNLRWLYNLLNNPLFATIKNGLTKS